jgi:glycosyltransferase involved in cell wall biosynthesis
VTVVCDQPGAAPLERRVCWLSTPHRGWGRIRYPVGLEHILHGRDLLVLHSGWVYHNVRAARSAARTGVPYLLTPHGAYDPNIFRRRMRSKRLWWKVFEQDLVSRARAIHVFFEEQRDELRQLGYGGPVIIAPTGLTTPDFKMQADRSEFLLWMGRFDIEIKGIDLLLHALASLHPSARPRTLLHGPDWRGGKEQTRRLVRELDLDDRVTIGPPLYGSQKWDALRNCRLFIFPSRWEGQGLIALEAAAAAAPLVVTSTTSVGRHLASARAAILVEPTAQSIAAGIVQGWSSSEAGELGTRASQLVREKFSWPAVAKSYTQQLGALL